MFVQIQIGLFQVLSLIAMALVPVFSAVFVCIKLDDFTEKKFNKKLKTRPLYYLTNSVGFYIILNIVIYVYALLAPLAELVLELS